jgi:hypothetical protein
MSSFVAPRTTNRSILGKREAVCTTKRVDLFGANYSVWLDNVQNRSGEVIRLGRVTIGHEREHTSRLYEQTTWDHDVSKQKILPCHNGWRQQRPNWQRCKDPLSLRLYPCPRTTPEWPIRAFKYLCCASWGWGYCDINIKVHGGKSPVI